MIDGLNFILRRILNYNLVWIEWFIDAKGIHPKANYKPAFKRKISTYREMGEVINLIQSIGYKDEIRFKDLDNRLVEII